jgi:site-specific recombinase XerD
LCSEVERYSENAITYLKRSCLQWAKYCYERGYLLQNPFVEFTAGDRRQVRQPKILTVSQIRRLLSITVVSEQVETRNKAIFEVAYGSGLRVGEIAALQLTSVDLSGRLLALRNTKNNWDRKVPMTTACAEALSRYLTEARPQLWSPHHDGALWLSKWGRPLSLVTLVALPMVYREKLDFHFTMHDLRRAFATHLLEGGASIAHIASLLGHRDLDSSRHYAQAQLRDLRAVQERTHPRGS